MEARKAIQKPPNSKNAKNGKKVVKSAKSEIDEIDPKAVEDIFDQIMGDESSVSSVEDLKPKEIPVIGKKMLDYCRAWILTHVPNR